MTPTTATERCRLYHGRAEDVMRALAPGSIDALVTDPPYSSGGMFRGDRMQSTGYKYASTEHRHLHADFTGDNRDQRSFTYWCTLWLAEAMRVVRPGGFALVFTDWRQLPSLTDALQAAGWLWRGIVPWDKTEAVRPQLGRFRCQAEYIVWATKGALKPQGPVAPGVFRHRVDIGDKLHQTAKPVALMRDLLQLCGDEILDPFMGGGGNRHRGARDRAPLHWRRARRPLLQRRRRTPDSRRVHRPAVRRPAAGPDFGD